MSVRYASVQRVKASVRSFVVAMTIALAIAVPIVRSAWPAPERRWSDATTWGGRVPQAGDRVSIPRGRSILLDVSPPALATLDVAGRLRFADRDLTLRARAIRVSGSVSIGRDGAPFVHRAEIVLDGTEAGGGAIVVADGGRFEAHGLPRATWTTLAATARAGTRSLRLSSTVDWRGGDRLALAPSGFDAREAEEVVVANASSGVDVALAEPLRYRHWGTIVDGIDERAEIGLLSHTIVVRSETSGAARGIGGQVIVMRGGTLRVSDVEFRNLGQRGKLGRYPVHFHEAGDAYGSAVVDSSIDHSYNRCLAIHGTNGVTVRGNVAYDTIGHCYFLEDGVERANVFEHDLGMLARAPAPGEAVLATDVRPAIFWISNPDNVVRDDRAAGSAGYGFWYDLAAVPGGLAHGGGIRPRTIALGTFADDVAHASEHDGLFVDNLRNPPGVTAAPNYEPPILADFVRFTSYKNRRHGVWLRGRRLAVTDARLGDNAIGATFAAADATLRDSVVVGRTGNETGVPKPDDPHFPVRGFEFYDGPVAVERTRFVNFVPDAERAASALSALEFSPFFMDPNQTVEDVRFTNALPVYFRRFSIARVADAAADGYRSVAFRDLDGSVAGRPDRTIVYDSPLLATGCTRTPAWNAAICDARYGSLFVLDLDGAATGMGPLRVSAGGARDRSSIVLAGNESGSAVRTSFQTNLAVGRRYVVSFGGRIPHRIRLGLHGVDDDDAIVVSIPQVRTCAPGGDVRLVAHGADRRASAVVDLGCTTPALVSAKLGRALQAPAALR